MEPIASTDSKLISELARIVAAVEASGRALLPSSTDDLLQAIVETAARIMSASAASIGLVDETGSELVFEVAVGVGHAEIVGTRMAFSEGIVGYVASTAQPLALSRAESDPRFAADISRRADYAPSSILAVPLFFDDRLLGVMELVDKNEGEPFTLQDIEVLGLFGRQAAIAIHNSHQFDLLGRVMVRRLDELVNVNRAPDLPRIEDAPESEGTDESTADLYRIADLFNSISRLGHSERVACIEILSTFSEYAHSRSRFSNPL